MDGEMDTCTVTHVWPTHASTYTHGDLHIKAEPNAQDQSMAELYHIDPHVLNSGEVATCKHAGCPLSYAQTHETTMWVRATKHQAHVTRRDEAMTERAPINAQHLHLHPHPHTRPPYMYVPGTTQAQCTLHISPHISILLACTHTAQGRKHTHCHAQHSYRAADQGIWSTHWYVHPHTHSLQDLGLYVHLMVSP